VTPYPSLEYAGYIPRSILFFLTILCQLLAMSLKGTFSWNGEDYKKKIKGYSRGDLIRHHHIKMARYYALCFGAVAALGGTGVGLAHGLRQIIIIREKLRIIVSRMLQRDWGKPRRRFRDFMLGAGIGILTLDLGIFGPPFIDCLVGHVADNAGEEHAKRSGRKQH
jgi:hypothetical protein